MSFHALGPSKGDVESVTGRRKEPSWSGLETSWRGFLQGFASGWRKKKPGRLLRPPRSLPLAIGEEMQCERVEQVFIGMAPRGCRNHDQQQCGGHTQRQGRQPKERFRSKAKLPLTRQGAGTGSSG